MIRLSRCRATCPHCGKTFNQIDGTPERAEEVVVRAVEKHIAEEHPDQAST